jgi:hypothetical protein
MSIVLSLYLIQLYCTVHYLHIIHQTSPFCTTCTWPVCACLVLGYKELEPRLQVTLFQHFPRLLVHLQSTKRKRGEILETEE